MPESTPKIGLALAGGAARGYAHLGILDYLNERSYPVAALSGCSMGAIISAFAAMGKTTEEMVELSQDFKFLKLIKLTWPRLGLSKVTRFEKFIHELLGDVQFDDLKIPLKIVACDIDTREEVVFDSGPVWKAVLASANIPILFEPFIDEGRRLVDGGIVRLNPAYNLKDCDLDGIIGTDIGMTRERVGPVKGFFDTIKQTVETMVMGQRLTSESVSDITLRPKILDKPFMNFNRLEEYKQLGYQSCVDQAELIDQLFGN